MCDETLTTLGHFGLPKGALLVNDVCNTTICEYEGNPTITSPEARRGSRTKTPALPCCPKEVTHGISRWRLIGSGVNASFSTKRRNAIGDDLGRFQG